MFIWAPSSTSAIASGLTMRKQLDAVSSHKKQNPLRRFTRPLKRG
jgi:hypothetical protein